MLACRLRTDAPPLLSELPRWRQVLVASVVGVYCGVACADLVVTRFQTGQVRLFLVLTGCSAAAVELTRRAGEPDGVVPDVYAIWDLPTAVLLPPVYALLVPVPRMAWTQLRVGQALVHRRAYTAAAVGLAYAIASLAFHAVAPALGPGAGAGVGGRALLWTLLAAGCGLLRLLVNDGLVLAAVQGVSPSAHLPSGISEAEALHGSVSGLCLGTLTAFAAVHSTLAILYALPLVISLQRSLRHAQLVAEARLDGKTGLLNDRTWRREAVEAITRAARDGSPMAVGLIDIDHFKRVNDTYGHPTGDAVLSAVAAALRATLRGYDVVGRVGGEEFAFVLSSPLREAVEVAERLRREIPRIELPGGTKGQASPRVTVSIGLVTADRAGWELSRYYSLADAALYAAKQGGRDRVWIVLADPAAGLSPRPADAVQAQIAHRAGK
jgi:diguanylate cyclase (GGDEF)-like protein